MNENSAETNVGERLLLLLKSQRKTQSQLCREIDISKNAMSNYVNGNRIPDTMTALKLSKALSVSMEWLLTGEDRKFTDFKSDNLPENSMIYNFNKLDETEKKLVYERIQSFIDLKSIAEKPSALTKKPCVSEQSKRIANNELLPATTTTPQSRKKPYHATATKEMRVFHQSASAGLGNYLYGEADYELISVDADNVPPNADFGIRISGDSMTPNIPDGCIVWVEEKHEIQNGQTGIFVLNNAEAYCKKLLIDYDARAVSLLSTNASYPPIIVRETDNLRTIGRIVGEPYIF